jgi:hypothetical protein
MVDGFQIGIGMPELFLILIAALLSAGWRTFRKR